MHTALAPGCPIATCCALVAVGPAGAQPYLSRPIRLIVPFPAGGSTDIAAQLVGDYLSRSWGQQVYVENKTGANGTIGVEAAARSTPDGYTILVATDSVASTPHVFKMNVDTSKDLIPIIQLSRQPVVLAVHPSLRVGSLAELTALARQQPGLRYVVLWTQGRLPMKGGLDQLLSDGGHE